MIALITQILKADYTDYRRCFNLCNLIFNRCNHKKYFFIALSLLAVSVPCNIALAQRSDKWHTAKSTHFIIYYKNAQEDFLEQLIEKAEDYYNKIADDLGFRRYNFWLWDNRAKIYIYDDAQDYQTASGQPGWSSGYAVVKDKIIYTFPYARGFFENILLHEMGHIIFREFVGFDNYAIPLWLDEGVASYQEKLRRSMANRLLKEAIENNSFINLEQLSNLDPKSMPNSEAVNIFYTESLSIVDYLIREFGKENFILFCQNLRDKRSLEQALSLSYPFNNLKELDRAWQGYLTGE